MNQKIILIAGASSGFGYALASRLAQLGHVVYAGSRRVEKMETLKQDGAMPVFLDVQDFSSIKNIVDLMIQNHGRIDILYANAGYGHYGAVELVSEDEAKRQFDVNVFGVHRLLQACLPHMRKAHQGRIVITGSAVSHISFPFGGWYSASKHAVYALSDSLRAELSPMKIKVCFIEPGVVKTEFNKIALNTIIDNDTEDYYKQIQDFERFMNNKYRIDTSVDSTIIAMIHAGMARFPRKVYATTWDSKGLSFISKILPTSWISKIMSILYKNAK